MGAPDICLLHKREGSKGIIKNPNTRVYAQGWSFLIPPTPWNYYSSCVVSILPKTCWRVKGNPKKKTLSSSEKEWFCWHRVEQYSMVVKYNKGIRVLFWFMLTYRGRKETNSKRLASSPDFRPVGTNPPRKHYRNEKYPLKTDQKREASRYSH